MAIITWRKPAMVNTLVYSNNDLTIQSTSSPYSGTEAIEAKTSGKWYWEIKINTVQTYGGTGIHKTGATIQGSYGFGHESLEYSYGKDGKKMNSYVAVAYGAAYTTGDVIGVAMDLDNKTLTFFKNGVSQGKAYDLPASTSFSAACSLWVGVHTANFGATPFAYASAFNSLPAGYMSYDGSQYASDSLYLIESYNKYYSIKPEYYDSIGNFYIPLTLSGGVTPNLADINTFGFRNISDLAIDTTINTQSFKPIDKIYDKFNVKRYKMK